MTNALDTLGQPTQEAGQNSLPVTQEIERHQQVLQDFKEWLRARPELWGKLGHPDRPVDGPDGLPGHTGHTYVFGINSNHK